MKQSSFNASELVSGHFIEPMKGNPIWSNLDFKSKTRSVSKIGGVWALLRVLQGSSYICW